MRLVLVLVVMEFCFTVLSSTINTASHTHPAVVSAATTVLQAAEAMDRAAATSLEHAEIVPPRYVRAFCGNEKHALERWKATLQWRKDNDIDSILNEPQPFFHDIRRYFPSNM